MISDVLLSYQMKLGRRSELKKRIEMHRQQAAGVDTFSTI
jgi:hypothetical protein